MLGAPLPMPASTSTGVRGRPICCYLSMILGMRQQLDDTFFGNALCDIRGWCIA